jgi:ABC-type transport system substrate-binding protein
MWNPWWGRHEAPGHATRVKRRDILLAGAAGTTSPWLALQASAAAPVKTLRVVQNIAEAGFDPPRVSDQTSVRINSHIFESPLTYDPLARPAVLVPLTAAGMPEVAADFRHFVFTLQPGILFADDPAFQSSNGQPRELVAADYVFSIKRYYDPATITEHLYLFENEKILGLTELRERALKSKTPFPYDTDVPGLRVLDRYRFEVRLAEPSPRFVHLLASPQCGAVAREVVQAYGSDLMAHPVGTGPFRLVAREWRRGSQIVLERNPRFRQQLFHTVGAGPEPHLQAAAARLAGTRSPRVDRVEMQIIEESQPRWLAFLRGEFDVLTVPSDFGQLAMPGGVVAPFLQRKGVQAERNLSPSLSHSFFNFDDPLVGGYTAEKVALRRAIAMAHDNHELVRSVIKDQAIVAQSVIPPECFGYAPNFKSELSSPSHARANALLDLHGYKRSQTSGNGWRTLPNGQPLLLRMAFPPDQRARALSELWFKHLSAVGLQVKFEFAKFGELIKRSLSGQLMIWSFIWAASSPDGDFFLGLTYGPNAGQSSDSRFKLPAFDALYERQRVLPDGPERLALMRQAQRLQLAYMPVIPHYHPIETELLQPGVQGPVRHPFNTDWYRWADIDSPVA